MDWVICFGLAILTICAVFFAIFFISSLADGKAWAWIIFGIAIAGLILWCFATMWHDALYLIMFV
jgi:hypothetical protein